uniref:Uncharacterized protein n=1 Tax=Ralstonia solanacearum TaxID=305 RepID=A0A0S4X176_RALSL|nr:protein of unknown function [Ralstonia solanacearum]
MMERRACRLRSSALDAGSGCIPLPIPIDLPPAPGSGFAWRNLISLAALRDVSPPPKVKGFVAHGVQKHGRGQSSLKGETSC